MAKAKKKDQPIKRTFRGADIKGGGQSRPKIEELVDVHKFGPEWSTLRFLGGFHEVLLCWIKILPKNSEKVIEVPRPVDDLDDNPYLELPNFSKTSAEYWQNVIVRGIKAKKYKPAEQEVSEGKLIVGLNKGPVRAVRFTPGVAKKLVEIADLQDEELSGPNGKEIMVRFEKSAPPSSMYSVMPGSVAKLSAAEREYLLWDLSVINPVSPAKEMKEDVQQLLKLAPPFEEDGEGSGGSSIDDYAKGGKKKKKKKGKRPF